MADRSKKLIFVHIILTVGFVLFLNGRGVWGPQVEEFGIVIAADINVQKEGSNQPDDLETQIDTYKKRVETLSREIEKGREEVEAFKRKETDVITRLNEVELALNKSRKRAVALKAEIKALEKKIAETTEVSEKLKKQVQTNEEYVAKRLIALYKMNWLGKFHLLASAESIHEFIQRKNALARILAYDEKIRRDLVKNQTDLNNVLAQLQAHKAEKSTRAAEYKEQIKVMSQERATRTNLLDEIRSQKSLELAAISALIQSAEELDQKIKLLSSKIDSVDPYKNESGLPFSAHKGLLIMPVNGKITSLFGPYKNQKYNVTNFRSGIDIKAEKGDPIRSVFKGKILYSDWFKGYGNMIIIDHGNNYYSIYAHLEETFKSKGDGVDTAEVIATAGDSGSMTGTKLYFEIRHHGNPLDPVKWLKTG
jgi:septal ring factor EnvC (AmiA/AmiB activator)